MSTRTLLVGLPLYLILAIALLHIWMRRDITRRRQILWTGACLLWWPAIAAYFLITPVMMGRRRVVGEAGADADPRTQLVGAVLAHDDGRLGDAEYARALAHFRRGGAHDLPR